MVELLKAREDNSASGPVKGARREHFKKKHMFKKLAIVAVAAFMSIVSQADVETVGGIEWTYRIEDGKAILGGGTSSATAVPAATAGEIEIPLTLGGCPVTAIGDSAFEDCSALTSVTIPESVTSLGSSAFDGCSSLTLFSVSPDNPSYKSVSGLLLAKDGSTLVRGVNGDVAIPGSVTNIGDAAFAACTGLTSVTIPDGVTNIGGGAFFWCSSLTNVTFRGNAPAIGLNAFYAAGYDVASGCTVHVSRSSTGWGVDIPGKWQNINIEYVPFELTVKDGNVTGYAGTCPADLNISDYANGVTSIWDAVFLGCSGLTSVTIPDGVTSIGDWAFSGCSGLTSVTIPFGVTSIGSDAFSGCSGLTSVTIPDSVTSIGGSAFYGCSGLTSVTIPNSVTSIGGQAFYGCSGLTSVTIPFGVTSIGEGAFNGCSGLTSVTIPSSVTSIGNWAFSGCSSLTSVTIPEGVTNIGEGTFHNCISLTNLTIPENVTSIGGYAFKECGLTSVTIGNSVISIEDCAFFGCGGLASVTIEDGVASIGEAVFSYCTNLTSVTIPESVTTIGRESFYGCTELTGIKIPGGVSSIDWETFCGSGLASIEIPGGVTNISVRAFADCGNLANIIFRGDAPRMDSYVFENIASGCTAYVSRSSTGWGVDIPGKWQGINIDYLPLLDVGFALNYDGLGGGAGIGIDRQVEYYGYPTLPGSGFTAREGYEFAGWFTAPSGGARVEDPSAVAVTEDVIYYAHWRQKHPTYDGCYVETVDGIEWTYHIEDGNAILAIGGPGGMAVPASTAGDLSVPEILGECPVTGIDTYAFANCPAITSVTIPDSVTFIGDGAFGECIGLTGIAIPASVTSIGSGVSEGCTSLVNIAVDENNTAYCSANGLLLTKDGKTLVAGINGDVTVPGSVTRIRENAFERLSGLTSVTFLGNAPTVGGFAFSEVAPGCTAYVSRESTGWGVGIPGTWKGINIAYARKAEPKLYVNAETGSNENSGESEIAALASIQAAIDLADAGDTIYVAAGSYDVFVSSNKAVNIIGVSGATETFIDGHEAYNNVAGHVLLRDTGTGITTNTVVEGFTFHRLTRIDGGILKRCIIRDNKTNSYGSGAHNAGIAENCLFLNNVGMNGAASDGSILRNCTIAGNRATSGYQGVCLNSILENCIVYNNAIDERQTWQYWFDQNPLVATYPYREKNVYVGDAGFVDSVNGDYRLAEGSPCIDAGDNSCASGQFDLEGNIRISNGTVDLGCYEHVVVAPSVFTVEFRVVGGSAAEASREVEAGAAIGELPDAVREGYSFAGWFTQASGGTRIGAGTIVEGNVAYYAHWRKNGNVEDQSETVDGNAWTYETSGYSSTAEIVGAAAAGSGAPAVSGDVTIPGELGGKPVTSIGKGAFQGCTEVTSIVIPDGVTTIGNYAFQGCTGLTSVTIPDSVENVGAGVFAGCSDDLFDTATIPGVKLLDGWAVGFTDALEGEVDLSGVRGIWYGAFYGCETITGLIIGDSCKTIMSYAFYNCANLENVSMGDNVGTIGGGAFYGCGALKSVEIPQFVCDSQLSSVFPTAAAGITNVTIKAGVVSIGARALRGCASLAGVTIPASVAKIGYQSFGDCSQLESVVFEGDAPQTDASAFAGTSQTCTATVARGTSGWGVEIPGVWKGIAIRYDGEEPADGANVSIGEKGTVEKNEAGGYSVAAKDGETLAEGDFSFEGAAPAEAYKIEIAPDGKSATVNLRPPEVLAPESVAGDGAEEDEEDPSGMLVVVEESKVAAKPVPQPGETVGAIPVKTYPGLFYSVSWGDELGSLTAGDKVPGASGTLYLGVIRQTGAKGFYKLTVSEE